SRPFKSRVSIVEEDELVCTLRFAARHLDERNNVHPVREHQLAALALTLRRLLERHHHSVQMREVFSAERVELPSVRLLGDLDFHKITEPSSTAPEELFQDLSSPVHRSRPVPNVLFVVLRGRDALRILRLPCAPVALAGLSRRVP